MNVNPIILIILIILGIIGLIPIILFILIFLATPIKYRIRNVDDIEVFFIKWSRILRDKSTITLADNKRQIALILFTKRVYKRKADCFTIRLFLTDFSEEKVTTIYNKLSLAGLKPIIKYTKKTSSPKSIESKVEISEPSFSEKIISLTKIALNESPLSFDTNLTISGSQSDKASNAPVEKELNTIPFTLIEVPMALINKFRVSRL